MADRAIEPVFSNGNPLVEPRRYVEQVVVEDHKLTLEVGGVGRDVALTLADHELLIAAQAAQLAERDDHSDQGNHCDDGGDYCN
jgi:hypothetical protein